MSDFGLSAIVKKEKCKSISGTATYLAPEVLIDKSHGCSVDLWSLGVLLFVLLTLNPPFYDENTKVLFEMIKNDPVPLDKYKKGFTKNAYLFLQQVFISLFSFIWHPFYLFN